MTECPAFPGSPRCPESICDCFIETHPDDPLGPHPEDFVVTFPDPPADLLTDLLTEDHTEAKDCE